MPSLRLSADRKSATFPPLGSGEIPQGLIGEVAVDLMSRAAIGIPADFKQAIHAMAKQEQHPLSRFVLDQITQNYAAAEADSVPCAAIPACRAGT